jgi:Flp pilus assembly protein TadG
MSPRSLLLRFLKDRAAGPTVEFVIIFPVLIFFVFFVFLLSVDFFWMLTAQKAVERGVREAVVRLPSANALVDPATGSLRVYTVPSSSPAVPGDDCTPAVGASLCNGFATVSCTGGSTVSSDGAPDSCTPARMEAIVEAVQKFIPSAEPADITVTYSDSLLGTAFGPYIPLVTLELQQSQEVFAFSWVDDIFNVGTAQQPTVSSSLIGELLEN